MGDGIICVPYGYLHDIEALQSLICKELFPFFYFLDYLVKKEDCSEKISDFSWRENVWGLFKKDFPKYLKEGKNMRDIDWTFTSQ
jgi:hypothetical protein